MLQDVCKGFHYYSIHTVMREHQTDSQVPKLKDQIFSLLFYSTRCPCCMMKIAACSITISVSLFLPVQNRVKAHIAQGHSLVIF